MSGAILHRIGLDGACVSIRLDAGRTAEITRRAGPSEWQIMPLAVDPHVHLDKSFIWPCARPATPGLFPAIAFTQADKQFWDAADLRCAAIWTGESRRPHWPGKCWGIWQRIGMGV